jgi:predicted DCC family thiol-disulfide oxidoreductase YuxK
LTEIDESATESSRSQLGPEPQPPDGERKPPLPRFNLVGWLRDRYLSVDPRWLGLFRVCYGLILISELVNRWLVARLFYSNDGLLPNHFSMFRPMGDDLFSLYHVASSVNEVHVAFALTLLVFVLFTLGYKTRLFHLLSLICITSLHSRNLFNENGGSVVVNILGLWTLFLPLGSRFSVDAVLASLRTRSERSSAELNDRSSPEPTVTPFVSVVVLALILQWSVIYFFNAVHKTGAGWRDGLAIHLFLWQDRIVTWVGVWAREHVPFAATKLMTQSTLWVEGALAGILLIPFWQRYTRRIALLLAIGLHGGIALLSRLGPFSYVMTAFFLLLFGESEFRWLARWFGRPGRKKTIVFDADCGICLWCSRLCKRLDPFACLTFVGNNEREKLPESLDAAALERTIVVIDARGRVFQEERALFEIARALPLGVLVGWWLVVPPFAQLARLLYRKVSANRLRISTLFGLGACGLPPEPSARDAERVARTSMPVPLGSLREETRGALVVAREASVALLMVVLGTQVATDNPFITRHARATRPAWMAKIVNYGRLLEGWGMFAPEPPFDDGVLVVDGRTKDGRKLDPFTGKEPEFDPFTKTGWGHDQLWCDYSNHIRWPHNQQRRQFLREYLQQQHVYSGRPQDQLVAFDVWWIQDKSPLPGQTKGEVLPPERLVSHGYVKDSGAQRWQPKGKSAPRRTPPSRPPTSARPEAKLPVPALSGEPSMLLENKP